MLPSETIETIVQEQIIDHLRRKSKCPRRQISMPCSDSHHILQVEDLVDELVERDVDYTVQDILDTVYLPQKLQDTVNSQRKQLDSIRINLHNA